MHMVTIHFLYISALKHIIEHIASPNATNDFGYSLSCDISLVILSQDTRPQYMCCCRRLRSIFVLYVLVNSSTLT
jgi:hypothetical protein